MYVRANLRVARSHSRIESGMISDRGEDPTGITRKPYGGGYSLPPIFMIEDLILPLVLLVTRLIRENEQLKSDLAKHGESYAQESDFFERESVLAENREDVDNQVMLGDTGLDVDEYDTNAAQLIDDLLFRKYF